MSSTAHIGPYIKYELPKSEMKALAFEAIRYALISSPFTINRMHLNDLEKRILNITKGKLSEMMFQQFAKEYGILLDFDTCSTPFFKADYRDFLYRSIEWDLKNNFVAHDSLHIDEDQLKALPALVPAKFEKDQWYKKSRPLFEGTKGVGFVFSFMINKLENGPLSTDFIEVNLSKEWKKWLIDLGNKYQGRIQRNAPFSEEWFWAQSEQKVLPWDNQIIQVNFSSPIYICSYATEAEWKLFRAFEPRSFGNGMMRTRIRNMGCAIAHLHPFQRLMNS